MASKDRGKNLSTPQYLVLELKNRKDNTEIFNTERKERLSKLIRGFWTVILGGEWNNTFQTMKKIIHDNL